MNKKKAPVKKTAASGPKPAGKKAPVKKQAPKAAQFGFQAMMGGGPKPMGKGKTKTTFATAKLAMDNMISDLELVDTKDTNDILNDPDRKTTLLNCIKNDDYDKFDMIIGMFKNPEEEKLDVNDL